MFTTPGGKLGLFEDLGEHEGTQRCRLGGLQDTGVARGEGRRQFPRRHQEWKVPRDYLPGDAERSGIRTEPGVVEFVGPPGVVEEMRGGQRDVDVTRFANRLCRCRGFRRRRARASAPESVGRSDRGTSSAARRWSWTRPCRRRDAPRSTARSTSTALADATMASDSSLAGLTVANCSWDSASLNEPSMNRPYCGFNLAIPADSGAGSYSSEPSCELASCRSVTSIPAEFVGANVRASLLLQSLHQQVIQQRRRTESERDRASTTWNPRSR